jgi:AraC-like DNA-binding protein
MQIAAKRLADPGLKIAVVAHEVGYESEAAFSRRSRNSSAGRRANGEQVRSKTRFRG